MENPKQVIIVGGGPGLCDRVRLLGADITLVDTPDGYDAALIPSVRRTVLTDYDDPSLIPMLRALHRETPFSAVLSLTEKGLLPAARIAEHLGIGALSPDVVGRTRDKSAMRAWLRDKAFSTVACAVVRDADDIRDFAGDHGYPVIVKPRHGKGSEHVRCFRLAEEVVMPPAITDDYIVEPFLSGPEFSVEAFSCDNDHKVVAITAKFTQKDDPENPFVETGHVVPAPVEADVSTAITEYTSAFLDVMGITDGCTHTELRMTASGPEVIETHTRVGGDSIPTLVRQATGHDLLDLLVQWSLDRTRPGAPAPTAAGAAAIRFFTPPPGRVAGISGVQRWQGLPGVLKFHLPLKAGDRVPSVQDSRTRAGYVLTTAPTAAQAIEICREVISGVRIDVR
ncbi:ATP-grasp domain-containing protein [Streptomyces sp. SID10853]|uniref:ATP-grasp domain-containing protein n=1 Tax=Streptomyces sp. SID10853 TaxID=2706028 RepID=UPI0013C1465C|nr:ATP-grasp domain-containing protein [Streptomyces sp. SID10853]NDZ81373.1 ATP-grasp domain-containing protein [Streptomyces sp. SID10853]